MCVRSLRHLEANIWIITFVDLTFSFLVLCMVTALVLLEILFYFPFFCFLRLKKMVMFC